MAQSFVYINPKGKFAQQTDDGIVYVDNVSDASIFCRRNHFFTKYPELKQCHALPVRQVITYEILPPGAVEDGPVQTENS